MVYRALVWLVVLVIAVLSLGGALKGQFTDAYVYYQAAHGDLVGRELTTPEGVKVWQGWLYADPLRVVFIPLSFFSFDVFSHFFYMGNVLLLVYLSFRLYEVTHYAAFLVGVCYLPLTQFMGGANIHLVLLALCTNPWGAALATAFKPQLIVFVFLHYIVEEYTVGRDIQVQGRKRAI
jgi:hypothetical protein